MCTRVSVRGSVAAVGGDEKDRADLGLDRDLGVASGVGRLGHGARQRVGPSVGDDLEAVRADGEAGRPRREAAAGKRQGHRAGADLGGGAVDRDDLAGQDVRLADEVGDEGGGRGVVELARGSLLGDHRAVHDDDAVGDGERLLLVVGDVGDGQAELLLQLADLVADAAAELGVEVRERLVEEQHLRLEDQGARDRDALLLAAGELGGEAGLEAGQADERQAVGGAGRGLAPVEAGEAQAVGDVLDHRHVREERVGLEDHRRRRGRSPAGG